MGKQDERTGSATGASHLGAESPLAVASRKVDAAIATRRQTQADLIKAREIMSQLERADQIAKVQLDAAVSEWTKLVDAAQKP